MSFSYIITLDKTSKIIFSTIIKSGWMYTMMLVYPDYCHINVVLLHNKLLPNPQNKRLENLSRLSKDRYGIRKVGIFLGMCYFSQVPGVIGC